MHIFIAYTEPICCSILQIMKIAHLNFVGTWLVSFFSFFLIAEFPSLLGYEFTIIHHIENMEFLVDGCSRYRLRT